MFWKPLNQFKRILVILPVNIQIYNQTIMSLLEYQADLRSIFVRTALILPQIPSNPILASLVLSRGLLTIFNIMVIISVIFWPSPRPK